MKDPSQKTNPNGRRVLILTRSACFENRRGPALKSGRERSLKMDMG